MNLSNFAGIAVLIAAAVCLSGCAAKKTPPKINPSDVFKQMQKDFKRMKNPRSSIKMMRKYALEKLPDASDEELVFLMGEPLVQPNYDGSMYAFFWKRSYGKGIEVLATPPPCRPIEVFRTRRVHFP